MTILLPGVVESSQPGNLSGRVQNYSVTTQVVPAAVRTYLAGSALAIPASGLKVGAKLSWTFNVTKDANGTALSTFDIAVGLLGTVADTARVSFVKPAGTAVADEGWVDIECRVKSVSATGVLLGEFSLTHNLAATGHATVPSVNVNAVSAGFDNTGNALIVGICLTSGAADNISVSFMEAEATRV